jgi:Tfp pilus assembly protein PilO
MVLAIALPIYRIKRERTDKRMQAQINAAERERAKSISTASELEHLRLLFPAEPGIAQFVEALYSSAQQSKLIVHNVQTESIGSKTSLRPAARPSANQPSAPLNSHRFAISIEGSFRSIAEYIRRVQNFERFKRINEIKLVPGKHGISGNISLELFSLKDQHAR